jgi:CHASE2 domain-containing sensor protein
MRREGERRDVFERYIGEIAKAINAITGDDPKAIYEALLKQAKSRTAVADQVLDEDGKVVKEDLAETDDEGVLIIPDAIAPAVAAATSTPLAPLDLDGKARAASKRGARKAAEPKASAAPKRAAKPAPESAARTELRARAAKAAGRGKAGGEDGARLF